MVEPSQPEADRIEEIEISLRTGLNRLRFEPQLEELYQHEHALSSARHVRFAAIFGLIVYAVFGLLDYTMVGVAFSQLALVQTRRRRHLSSLPPQPQAPRCPPGAPMLARCPGRSERMGQVPS